MKSKHLLSIVAFLLILPVTSNGQVGNLLKNRLNKAVSSGAKALVNEKVQEADTTVENGVTDTRDQDDTNADNENPGQGQINLGRLMGNKIDLKHNDNYNFTSRIYMVSETYDDDEVFKMDFYMYYSSNSPTVGVETKTVSVEGGEGAPLVSSMVMDGENKCFLVLTNVNGMKMGIISPIEDEDSAQPDSDSKRSKDSPPPSFTKTGNTRMIAGYKCDEYSYSDSEDKTAGKVWFTKDANLKIDKRGWQNSGMDLYYGNNEFNEGVILANETYDSKGKLITKSETKEINKDFPHSISIGDYTLRQVNTGRGQNK